MGDRRQLAFELHSFLSYVPMSLAYLGKGRRKEPRISLRELLNGRYNYDNSRSICDHVAGVLFTFFHLNSLLAYLRSEGNERVKPISGNPPILSLCHSKTHGALDLRTHYYTAVMNLSTSVKFVLPRGANLDERPIYKVEIPLRRRSVPPISIPFSLKYIFALASSGA